jgi:hypothetical protein
MLSWQSARIDSRFRFSNLRPQIFLITMALLIVSGLVVADHRQAQAGEVVSSSGYKVLDPIRHGNLTIFPVVSSKTYPTGEFLTLDEGLRSGEVVVTESGSMQGLIRRGTVPVQHDGARVNTLVLVNNSSRPLLLLAGEIVTGGKQDRVIGKDRIIPPQSDPIDLGVFCVEPGRWVATSDRFNTSEATYAANRIPTPSSGGIGSGVAGGTGAGTVSVSAEGTSRVPTTASELPTTMMAQPSVRAKAMADKDQALVWSEVRKQQDAVRVQVAAAAPAPATTTQEVMATSSYAKLMENQEVKKQVDSVAAPLEENYRSLIGQLRDRHAVGVVVAVNGRIIWADVFASTDLLEKYWPKLVRSYASEAVVTRAKDVEVSLTRAQAFLEDLEGRHETIEREPGVYRHSEVTGDGFKAFAITSLLPKTGFDVHIAKMAD